MAKAEEDCSATFGYWVQRRRTALDLTRRELALRVGCSPVTVKKIERDERRPSLQIAALLADHLVISDGERDIFIRMARGEFVPTSLSAPDMISLPSFLWVPDVAQADAAPLVARDHQLAQLDTYLDAALAEQGGIVFISGEAGDGKTMLAQAFVRQSQEKCAELVVANGNCNAYTGIGDPYLPFREILELLTGNIETHWDASTMCHTYAERLWHVVPHTVEALLNTGPDLVDTFLLGPPLLAHAAAAATPQSDARLARLQNLIDQHQNKHSSANLHQSNLFVQYTRVLQAVARQQPLLLIVDDLQWADAGSISLLFHLSRHLKGQRILLVGLYRAAEVALGRDGERHPLEPLLNELQRTFGDIHIRLNQTNGRHFVDALVDSEPNQLDRTFRDALYKQTAGHPLFTVEMVHGLRERGDLVQNDNGEWIQSPALGWNILPARVEGIIKERVRRLSPPLQTLLQVASVMGETFYAETIAHVQDRDERQIISQLGTTLAKEQRLVTVLGNQQIGTQQLSQFRFRHILFQQYLYNGLDPLQRVYLHRAIAQELEQQYGSEAHLIAAQLAQHYRIGGEQSRALHYYMVAGDSAAAIYANAEAEAHYRSALALIRTAPSDANLPEYHPQLLPLYTRLGRILELSARYNEAIAVYEEMERVAQMHDAQTLVLASLLARAAIRTTVNFAHNPAEAKVLLARASALALDLHDEVAEAKILWNLLILSAYTGDDPQNRLALGEKALARTRKLAMPEQLAFILHDNFYAYAGAGQWEQARSTLHEARVLWQRLDNLPMLSEAHMRLHWTYLVTGDYDQAVAHAAEAYRLGIESHNRDAQALSHFMIGFVHWERGEIDRALATMEDDLALAEPINSLTPLIGTRAELGLLYGEVGDVERGLELARQARSLAEEHLPILRFWPHAIQVSLHMHQGNVGNAARRIATLADYQTVKARFGYMPFMWIRVGLAEGEWALRQHDFTRAVALMDALYQDLDGAGICYLRPDVLHLQGRALLGVEKIDEARDVLLAARTAAESLGSRRSLWPILRSLRELASQTGRLNEAESLRREAGEIVAYMCEHIQMPALRTAFLKLPQVKSVRNA